MKQLLENRGGNITGSIASTVVFAAFCGFTLITNGLFAIGSERPDKEVVLTLTDDVYVDNASVTLRDAAQCVSVVALCDEFYAIELAKVSTPGSSVILAERDILEVVSKEWPDYTFEISGRKSTMIRSHFRSVTKEDVISKINAALNQIDWPDYMSGVSVRDIYGFTSVKLWPQDHSIQVLELQSELFSGGGEQALSFLMGLRKLHVSIEQLEPSGSSQSKFEVSPQYDFYANVFATRHLLEKGHLIRENDLQIVTEKFTRWQEMKSVVTSAAALKEMQVRRTISPGTVIRYSDLSKNHLVKKGSSIDLISRRGSLEIRFKAKAMEAGGRGDQVKFQNIFNGKIVIGNVISAHEAVVGVTEEEKSTELF